MCVQEVPLLFLSHVDHVAGQLVRLYSRSSSNGRGGRASADKSMLPGYSNAALSAKLEATRQAFRTLQVIKRSRCRLVKGSLRLWWAPDRLVQLKMFVEHATKGWPLRTLACHGRLMPQTLSCSDLMLRWSTALGSTFPPAWLRGAEVELLF